MSAATRSDVSRTSASLLERIKDWNDRSSWEDFERTYGGLILGVARKHGLSEEEAADVKQDTLLSVAKGIQGFSYDRERCTFKTWLFNLTRSRIVDLLRRRPREVLFST